MSNGYVLASDVFERLREGVFSLNNTRWISQVFLSPLQVEILREARDDLSIALRRGSAPIDVQGTPSAIAVQIARLSQDVATCPSDNLFGLLARAGAGGMSARHIRNQDLIVAQLAIRNQFDVVTDNASLARAIRQCGGSPVNTYEFFS